MMWRESFVLIFLGVVVLLAVSCGIGEERGGNTKVAETTGRLGEMVSIPAGSFLMGNNGQEGFGGGGNGTLFVIESVLGPRCR